MQRATAIIRHGRVELTEPVDWPDGTAVEVVFLQPAETPIRWLSLPPLDVGRFREVTSQDDLLAEMLDDSRN
ncbi:MAG: hypothetical protein GXY83_03995 [Rhodopirellula sp.]|nr:hypothetical protein [Rhodopirellula sp.]